MDVIFFDLQKTFDKVPHMRLLENIKAHGVESKIHIWIEKWCTRRQQRVVVNVHQSGWTDVTSGVLQGSVLDPTLFYHFHK